jgi:hypothetical protein
MTQAELQIELDKSGYPTVYGSFKEPKAPPYVVFIRPSADTVSSDYKVHGKFQDYIVELYTKQKDLVAEKKLEDILGTIDPEYDTLEVYIDTEKLFLVTYSITIFEKVGN